MTNRMTTSSSAAAQNPTTGENNKAWPISAAFPQSTPEVPSWPRIRALAMPTPMIDPISVCELEAGKPRYQVPRFQIIAAISRANTMAKPAALPTWRMSSTGSSDTIPNATAPDEISTPRKLKEPDHTTAIGAGSEWV
jgi:hypothetical protein